MTYIFTMDAVLFGSCLFLALVLIFASWSWVKNQPLRKIPGPKGHLLFGNTMDFSVCADHHALLIKWAREYGGIFKYYVLFGGYRVHVTDPDVAKHVIVSNNKNYRRQDVLKQMLPDLGNGLITANGRDHAIQRKQLNPFFSSSKIKDYLPVFAQKAEELVQFWKCKISDTKDCDVLEKLTHLTLDVVGQCAFGYHFNCILGGHSEESRATDVILRTSFDLKEKSLDKLCPLRKVFKSKNNEFLKAQSCFHDFIKKIIQQRRKDTSDGNRKKTEDLLQILFEMKNEGGERLTGEEIFHQVYTFMIAGHETTSLTATWALFLLSKHPHIQHKVRKEIQDTLGANRAISWQDLERMEYLDKCIKEAMRLYPIAITTDRTFIKSDKLGPYEIPAGTHVMIGIGTLHRLDTFWNSPDEFNPDRFYIQDEEKLRKLQYHFLPFSRGPRMCIGYRFALVELKVTLAKLLQSFTFKSSCSGHVKSISALTLKPFPAPILQMGLVKAEL